MRKIIVICFFVLIGITIYVGSILKISMDKQSKILDLAIQREARETEIEWEYIMLNPDDGVFEVALNEYGKLGWELVFARRARDFKDDFAYECILKRRIIKNKDGK